MVCKETKKDDVSVTHMHLDSNHLFCCCFHFNLLLKLADVCQHRQSMTSMLFEGMPWLHAFANDYNDSHVVLAVVINCNNCVTCLFSPIGSLSLRDSIGFVNYLHYGIIQMNRSFSVHLLRKGIC